jgi:hypothetical protein
MEMLVFVFLLSGIYDTWLAVSVSGFGGSHFMVLYWMRHSS